MISSMISYHAYFIKQYGDLKISTENVRLSARFGDLENPADNQRARNFQPDAHVLITWVRAKGQP